MPERPLFFDYTLRTADDCEGCFHYELLGDVITMAPPTPAWSPGEPELETVEATLEITYGPGGRVDLLELTGDQHRDLEDRGLFDDLLREIGAGRSPEEALTRTLERPPRDDAALTEDAIRAEWRAAGGSIHGPHVETMTMAEELYFAFRRGLPAPVTAPTSNPSDVSDYLRRLRELCERSGISLFEGEQEATGDRWRWRDENGHTSNACLYSERAAALDALDARFGDAWRHDVSQGDTCRGFLDYVSAELDAAEDVPEADAENEGGMRP